MSISFQTNVTSLIAQNNLRVNTQFQNQTIQQLTSGYRINSSGDDAAGLAVANKYRSDTAELTQGVRNANDGISTFQTIDSGLSNISQILDRLKTLATQSASATFTGDRGTLNTEYQTLLGEVNRQASNIGLNSGGTFNTNLNVYIGGGNNATNAQISVNLSGVQNTVDSTGLGINNSSIAGGGISLASNTVRLDNTAVSFLTSNNSTQASQAFTFKITDSNGNNSSVSVSVKGNTDGTGVSGQSVIDQLNAGLQTYGINAAIGSDGKVQFSGSTAFSVTAGALADTTHDANAVATATSSANNTSNYTADGDLSTVVDDNSGATPETFTIQNAGKSYNLTLDATTGGSVSAAITSLNTQLKGSGIYAVQSATTNHISFQSTSAFSIVQTQAANAGGLFTGTGAQTVTAPATTNTTTGSAISALASLEQAVSSLGQIQGRVGAGENKLSYAVNLAQSQITDFSAAESRIRDTDVAAEAANLTKAQVLQQSSIAALAQANSAPQAILSLLKG